MPTSVRGECVKMIVEQWADGGGPEDGRDDQRQDRMFGLAPQAGAGG